MLRPYFAKLGVWRQCDLSLNTLLPRVVPNFAGKTVKKKVNKENPKQIHRSSYRNIRLSLQMFSKFSWALCDKICHTKMPICLQDVRRHVSQHWCLAGARAGGGGGGGGRPRPAFLSFLCSSSPPCQLLLSFEVTMENILPCITLIMNCPMKARMAWTAWLCTKTWEQQPAVCGWSTKNCWSKWWVTSNFSIVYPLSVLFKNLKQHHEVGLAGNNPVANWFPVLQGDLCVRCGWSGLRFSVSFVNAWFWSALCSC